ncbi:aminodeoxychorismate lyase [Shewanella aestuarii]|uniref:Aminodeoxychorismate lyase n=1 Tax=Shewanella aestuarii TaxID=1028752 RepID=A0A6G9QK18_9GAMM|nr:aminodeoxychorismate lyase [Shewanella aestuarii]QIR14728.1 aminodeoxychorismate lyase [Shewanella aestuarii]
MTTIWVNQQPQNTVNAADRGLAYGDGAFATMRSLPIMQQSAQQRILFLDLHLSRLEQTCARLGIMWSASAKLIDHLLHLASNHPNACIKLLLSRGVGGRGYQAPANQTELQVTEVTSVHAIPAHYLSWQQHGIKLATSAINLGRQPLLAGMKHLNRLEQVLIKSQPIKDGFDDWLVYDTQGVLVEASMANVFLVKDKQIYTPAINQAGVSGVMREVVIDTILAIGFAVNATTLTEDDIYQADSLMMSNSLLGLIDVVQVDTKALKPWQHTKQVADILKTHLQ